MPVGRRTSSRACRWPCGRPPRPARTRWRSTAGRPGRRPTGGATRGRRRALVTRRVIASSMARWIVDLPASLGPRTTVTPGRQVDVELAVPAQVADLEPPDPHSETSWPASSSRPRRRASRSSAASAVAARTARVVGGAASSSAMRASRSRMNAPAIVSGDGQGALGQGGQAHVADPHLEERPGQRGLDLVEVQVELVRPDADHAGVEDEVRDRPSWRASR